MSDVELEIIDLATGESVGTFQLDLCVPREYTLDMGDYRFTVTYLKTGEALESDVSIVEGTNPPLEFEFSALIPPCTDWLTQEECEAAGCHWYDGACHPKVPPTPPIDLATIGGIAVAVVDVALILYYIATHISSVRE